MFLLLLFFSMADQSGNKNANEHYSTSATTYVLLKCTVTNICRRQQTYDNRHLLYNGSAPWSQTNHLSQSPDPAGCPWWAGWKASVLQPAAVNLLVKERTEKEGEVLLLESDVPYGSENAVLHPWFKTGLWFFFSERSFSKGYSVYSTHKSSWGAFWMEETCGTKEK